MAKTVPVPLDPDEIKASLKTTRVGKDVIVYSSTSSTNDIAWQYAKDKKTDGLVVFAEEQTAGRGRGTNKWLSSRAESILCSIVLLDCKVPAELLTLTCGVTVAEAIGKLGQHEPKVKWPNDVVINGKKVAGILLESKNRRGITDYVLGVGINCHQTTKSFPVEIRATATSIDIEAGAVCDRNLLAKRLLVSIDDWLLAASGDAEKVLLSWRRLSTLLGRRITLACNNREFSGSCIGVDPAKGLTIQLDRGGVRMFDAAHTTIVRQYF